MRIKTVLLSFTLALSTVTLGVAPIQPLRTENANKRPPAKEPKTPKEIAGGNPCGAPEYRQLDFWVGEWEVRGPLGRHLGDSRVQQILRDCVVFENWSGADGS